MELHSVGNGTQVEGKDLEVEEDPAEACGENWMEEQGAEVLEGGDQLKSIQLRCLGRTQWRSRILRGMGLWRTCREC